MKVFYVSSYGKNNDKGIYIMKFDEETLEMKRVQQILTKDFPSYMITKIMSFMSLIKMQVLTMMVEALEVLQFILMN